ncbi:MAG: ferritin family protein [Deltaproteobacteria bacterium]|nr:ferritin family protein [Deltaproteobacteria bacterium]
MDPVHFSAEEVLKMAIDIEKNGEKFYQDAAKAVSNEKLRTLYTTLANDEAKHTAYFSRLKDLLLKDGKEEVFTDEFEEASMYITAYADSKVFTEPTEGAQYAKVAGDERGALELAINMEKDSLLFYYELLRAVRDKDRGIINEIINEEKEHLKKLTDMKNEIFG